MLKLSAILSLVFLTTSLFASSLDQIYSGNCTSDKKICVYFSPGDLPVLAVAKELRKAKQSIKIATYNMNIDEYLNILKSKIGSGVEVKFLVDFKLSLSSNSVWRGLYESSKLKKLKIPVLRGGMPQMHNKLIFIDDHTLITGSANYTSSGLVGNYENVMVIKDKETIDQFMAEFNELEFLANLSCQLFADGNCSDDSSWDYNFTQFATTGKIPDEVLNSGIKRCQKLKEGRGLLDSSDRPNVTNVKECFKDKRYVTLVNGFSNFMKETTNGNGAGNRIKSYFAPDDGIDKVILKELSKTLHDPANSFAYISVNFITNKDIAKKLVEMFYAGVRIKLFFDRGRYEDKFFQGAIKVLSPLGFTFGTDRSDRDLVTIFNNSISGPYGCNHNKMAVVGTPNGLKLLNGSANWSYGAVYKNDENLMIINDQEVVSIYLKEILSQLYVYRYGQDKHSPGFWDDYLYLRDKSPCLTALIGEKNSCFVNGREWTPNKRSTVILSVSDVPVSEEDSNLWVWVPQMDLALPAFSSYTFGGRWVSTIPLYLGSKVSFKFFTMPKYLNPNSDGLGSANWEYSSGEDDRIEFAAELGVDVIRRVYQFGKQ